MTTNNGNSIHLEESTHFDEIKLLGTKTVYLNDNKNKSHENVGNEFETNMRQYDEERYAKLTIKEEFFEGDVIDKTRIKNLSKVKVRNNKKLVFKFEDGKYSSKCAQIFLNVHESDLHHFTTVAWSKVAKLAGRQMLSINYKFLKINENKEKNSFFLQSNDSMQKRKSIAARNFSLESRRHQKTNGICNISLVKLLQCSTLKLLHRKFLYKIGSQIDIFGQIPKNKSSYKVIKGSIYKNLLNRYSKPIKSKPLARSLKSLDKQKEMLNKKSSQRCESIVCSFPYRFTCFVLVAEDFIESVLSQQHKLEIHPLVHSRIVIQLNDFLINEDDNRYCRIIVESIKKSYLLLTLDLVNFVFPNWDVWNNGCLDKHYFSL